MVMAWLGAAGAFLKRVPSWAYIALAAVAVVWFAYHKGASDKDAEWEARLEKAAIEQQRKANEARAQADADAQHRADEHEAKSDELRKLIDEAERTGTANPLDELVSGLRP